ncbi:hypothetical protein F5Y10DRAFT_240718 [Nemania abortiva]|nr:hypothetical protein F5Y10DRAFT_240718 [Nemania abortiva]
MFEGLQLRHVPTLLFASLAAAGVLWPALDPRRALLEFGFPTRIANSPEAAPVMLVAQIRTTSIGIVMYALYLQGKMDALDTILAVYGVLAGIVDGYAVWKQGDTKKALFRLVGSWSFAAYGLAGLTAGR